MTQNNLESERWFACRVFHNKIASLKQKLTQDTVQYFIPVRLEQKAHDGGFVYVEEPIIPSLVFIRTTETYLHELKKNCSPHISIYTKPGTTEAASIPDREMEIFMYVLSKGCEQLESMDEKLVKGNHVRITGGLFEGAEGYITRVHGTKRFVVMVRGVAAVATTFIPRCFIEKID